MADYSPSFALPSSSHQSSVLRIVALIVVLIHIGFLGISYIWQSNPLTAKKPVKLVVQTIQLEPFKTKTTQTTAFIQSPSVPLDLNQSIEPSAKIENPPIVKEEIIALQEEPIQEIPLKLTETPLETPKLIEPTQVDKIEKKPLPVEIKPSPLHEVKPEKIKPIPKEVKSSSVKQEVKKPIAAPVKKPPAPAAPVKKPAETPIKPITKETAKPKPNPDVEKKKQQEKIEAERKQQLEKEAEKKRQKEIAAAQEAELQQKQARWKKMNDQLAKADASRAKIDTSLSTAKIEPTVVPQELGHLQIDALPFADANSSSSIGIKERNYSDEVAIRLKKGLQLPDYGSVKIKLTLDRQGKVIKIETLQSESQKNKIYLESKIPSFSFPSFGQQFSGASQNTFVITLQNDS